MTSPSSTSRPARTSSTFCGPSGRQADDVAVVLEDRLGNAVVEREPRLLAHVAVLAMDRDDDFGPHPVVHLDQFGPAGMAGDVDVGLLLGDDRRRRGRAAGS